MKSGRPTGFLDASFVVTRRRDGLLSVQRGLAAGQRREEDEAIARSERPVAGRVVAVQESDPGHVGRDTEPDRDVGDGAAFGEVEDGRAVAAVVGEKRGQRREESDFD